MNGYQPRDLRTRTKEFALQVIRLYRDLPESGVVDVIGRQVLGSGTSVGAQYREACRAKSPADFVNKMEGSLQELDETDYWFELLEAADIVPTAELSGLRREANELLAMFVASVKTTKRNHPKPRK